MEGTVNFDLFSCEITAPEILHYVIITMDQSTKAKMDRMTYRYTGKGGGVTFNSPFHTTILSYYHFIHSNFLKESFVYGTLT